MKRWLCWLALPLAAAQNPELGRVQTVYLLRMGHGLDQYLAAHLTRLGVFQVVADPARADAVFTDHLGEAFEQRLSELFPPGERRSQESKSEEGEAQAAAREEAPRISSWGRGRGTVFLVDARTRTVLWSIYAPPRDSSAEQVQRAARRIAERLKRELRGK
ncbi:MAG: hypothetical protein RMI94_09460 [Bryobacterales bacterium]|nr:hypothetical protein [Bryobacteraceae bacterium]MDW8130761.1 hypothetical protein [Bryobacterales bacterium]